MSKRWIQDHHRDAHYRKAKREGYRARSAYKLVEINKRYQVIRPHDNVVDLGCAPGGWLQVIREITDGKVIGIDIKRIDPLPDVMFIRGDMTSDAVLQELAEKAGGTVHTVVSDMSPNISGHYSMDQANSVYLAEMALRTAEALLGLGGNFVVKVFEGDLFQKFLRQVRSRFSRVKVHNPKASRKTSSEVYVIGKNYYPSERLKGQGDISAVRVVGKGLEIETLQENGERGAAGYDGNQDEREAVGHQGSGDEGKSGENLDEGEGS